MKLSLLSITFVLLSFSVLAKGSGNQAIKAYDEERVDEAFLDSLEDRFGKGKKFPEAYRPSFLIALSAYPELKETPIVLRRGDIRTSMLARPSPRTLLSPRTERRFRILIDTLDPASEGKLFNELPFQARIGIMAHELAHVLDYTRRDFGGILRYGIRYLFKPARKELEARTDRIAVERGFGWQLLAFKEHLRKEAELEPSYRRYKARIYLSHKDLRAILRDHPDYSFASAQR